MFGVSPLGLFNSALFCDVSHFMTDVPYATSYYGFTLGKEYVRSDDDKPTRWTFVGYAEDFLHMDEPEEWTYRSDALFFRKAGSAVGCVEHWCTDVACEIFVEPPGGNNSGSCDDDDDDNIE
jgi:hypothetical protein